MSVKKRKPSLSLGPVLLLGVTSLIGIFSFLTLYTTIQAEWAPTFGQTSWLIFPKESQNAGIYQKKNIDEESSEIIFIEANPDHNGKYTILPTFRMKSTDQYNTYLIPEKLNTACLGIYKNGVYQPFVIANEHSNTSFSPEPQRCNGYDFAGVNLVR